MRNASVSLISWLPQPAKKRAYCLSITQHPDNGTTTVRGTSWDRDLPIQGPTDSAVETYYHTSGGAISDIESSAALNVDNLEIRCNFDAITADDLKRGLWDNATYSLFLVNPEDLTMGVLREMDGKIGQVTVDRLTFTAELRGLMQALQQSIGLLLAPTCHYVLGDEFCTVDLGPLTVTGTLDDVSDDQLTLFDSARTEPGPSGGVSITNIATANPVVVTTASMLGLPFGSGVYLSGSGGPVALNGPWQVRSPSGLTFELEYDGTNLPAFAGTWTVTSLGAEAGYFDDGLITVTNGLNAGITRRVKIYVLGRWTLHEPFPFPLNGNETYSMTPGCAKTAFVCRTVYNNLLNFPGFPYVPGNDALMQLGRAA